MFTKSGRTRGHGENAESNLMVKAPEEYITADTWQAALHKTLKSILVN